MNNYSLILLLNNLESKLLKRSTYCQSALNFLAILDKFQQRYVIHMSQRNRQSAFRWHAVIWQYETSGFNGSIPLAWAKTSQSPVSSERLAILEKRSFSDGQAPKLGGEVKIHWQVIEV